MENGHLIIPPSLSVIVKGTIGEVDIYENNIGYINPDDGYVYIYSNVKPVLNTEKPYFYIEGGKLHFSSWDSIPKEKWHKDNIDYLSLAKIIKNTNVGDKILTDEQISDINMSSSRLLPEFSESDDFLKKCIKHVMHSKQIILAKLKSAIKDSSWYFNNLRTALFKDTKLTPPNFRRWCELLGIDFVLTVYDNGTDRSNPLETVITFRSVDDDCRLNMDYEMIDFTKDQVKLVKKNLTSMKDEVNEMLESVGDVNHKSHHLVRSLTEIARTIESMEENI